MKKRCERIIYQVSGVGGAFSYIDNGIMNGYRSVGAEVIAWDARSNIPDLRNVLKKYKPTVFLGNMQGPDRQPSTWITDGKLSLLRRYRFFHRLRVALRTLPSNMGELSRSWDIDFNEYRECGVSSFYMQPDRPLDAERALLESGFVDLLRSPLAHHTYSTCFKNFLSYGIPILEEPHAADLTEYSCVESEKVVDVQYIGGCWPFKLRNMEPYVRAIRAQFGDRFRLFGKGWPEWCGNSALDDESFNKCVAEARVNLAFHEPTQVTSSPFSGNERIFKLLALGAYVISDANPLLRYHFDVGKHLDVASSPDRMVDAIKAALGNKSRRERMAEAGRLHVMAEHSYANRADRLLWLLREMKNNTALVIPYHK